MFFLLGPSDCPRRPGGHSRDRYPSFACEGLSEWRAQAKAGRGDLPLLATVFTGIADPVCGESQTFHIVESSLCSNVLALGHNLDVQAIYYCVEFGVMSWLLGVSRALFDLSMGLC